MLEDVISAILRREGGYVNHPADRGGPTKYGITVATLAQWRGHPVDGADIAGLTEEEARRIYGALYITRPKFDLIADERLRALVIDCGVNHGVGTAAKMLQRAAGVTDDGKVGPATLAAVNGADAGRLYLRVLAERIKFYGRIITNDPKQSAFAAGWMARAAEFLEA